ncbi:MAG: DMT family transporter [Pseudomonadota bacterium]
MALLWIPVTIAAAFLQNLRSVLQKAIKGRLSTAGAAYARFFYAWPFALAYLAVLYWGVGYDLPKPNLAFLVYCLLGGVSQILFTVVLLWMFSFRSFAVGTTFSKMEVILVAVLGAILLGDTVSALAIFAITLSSVGIVLLSLQETKMSPGGLLRGLREKATWIGLLCAALLGASSVFFRGAALALDGPDFVMAAAYALVVALILQTLIMGAWFVLMDRPQLVSVVREWRHAAPIGLVGMLTSACWFTAFTLQNAAYVRALGQVELLFTYAATVFIFREAISRHEVIGTLLIACAIVLILVAS